MGTKFQVDVTNPKGIETIQMLYEKGLIDKDGYLKDENEGTIEKVENIRKLIDSK